MLTQLRLKQVLHYAADSGVFTWEAGRCIGNVAGTPHGPHIRIQIDGKIRYAQRLVWLYVYGYSPTGMIDHINGDGTDNRLKNLRVVTPAENAQNRRRAQSSNSTGLLGVSRCEGKFRSLIQINGKSKHLGVFDDPLEAHSVYLEAKRKYHPGCTI